MLSEQEQLDIQEVDLLEVDLPEDDLPEDDLFEDDLFEDDPKDYSGILDSLILIRGDSCI